MATHSQNMKNRKINKNNTSGYKGVQWHKRDKKWRASIVVNKNKIHLGCFNCPKEAHDAYCRAAKELHGEFARTG